MRSVLRDLFQSLSLFKSIHSLGSFCEWILSFLRSVLHHSSWNTTHKANSVSISFFLLGISKGTSEHILVLLFWEIDIIVSVWMWVLSEIVSIILPGRISSQVICGSEWPVLDSEITHWSSFVVITDGHSSLVGLIINSLSSEEPLSSFSESFENVVWANLHDGDFLTVALFSTTLWSAVLILSNLSITSSWDLLWLESHEFGLLHVEVALTTLFVTQSLVLSIWIPVIMGLIVSMIVIEGIIKVTPEPW